MSIVRISSLVDSHKPVAFAGDTGRGASSRVLVTANLELPSVAMPRDGRFINELVTSVTRSFAHLTPTALRVRLLGDLLRAPSPAVAFFINSVTDTDARGHIHASVAELLSGGPIRAAVSVAAG